MNDSKRASAIPEDMTWRELETRYALVGFAGSPTSRELELCLGERGGQVIREEDETTLLVPMQDLEAVLAARPKARCERDLVWFRFDAAMDWEVVGFLARVTSALAAREVPVGAVCGFSRDSLFVALPHRDRARATLERLFPERR